MNIAKKALVLVLASMPAINMTAYGTLQRRITAFSANALCRSPRSPPSAKRRHTQAAIFHLPLLATMQQQCHSKQQFAASRCLSTNYITQLFVTSEDDDSSESSDGEERTSFNIPALKKETTRLTLRTHKKIGKASTRVRAAEEQIDKLRVAIDASESDEVDEKLLQKLEDAPNVEQYKVELKELQTRLQQLNWLEEQFGKSPLKSKKNLSSEDMQTTIPQGEKVLQYILELDISDDESQKKKRIEENARNRRSKKERATLEQNRQQQGARLPYRRYYTQKNVEIRVGKQATDNDVLSLSPEHRSGAHWWYHASGCAGSHVVLCTDVASPSEGDVLDAASLAALKSKCIGQSVIKVSMTRARNVSKPRGAKPGLVQLNGDVKTITVRKSEVEKRCQRLEETVVVN